jgi:LysM repeat protein
LQAVQSARRRIPRRGWWLVPLLGLLPVLVAVVLASEGRFGAPGGQPVATGALATSTTVAGKPAPVSGVPLGPTATAAGQTATNPTTGSPGQPNAAQSTGTNGAQTTPAQPRATTAAGTTTGISPIQSTGAGATTNGTSTATGETGNSIQAATGPFRAYAVQPGDTVKFVAQMYGVSPASISQASGLQNPDLVRVGQVLTIPAQPGWLYRVQPGESLDQIAARTGVPTPIIVSASKLATDSVRPGDVILIPDQALAVSK